MHGIGWVHSAAGCMEQDGRTAQDGCAVLLGARSRALHIGCSIPTAGCQIPTPTQEAVEALGAVRRAGPAGEMQAKGWRRKSRSAPSRQRHPGTEQPAFEEAGRGIGRDVPGRTACSWPRCESSRNGRPRANAVVETLGVPGVRRRGAAMGCRVWGRRERRGEAAAASVGLEL